MQLKDLYVDWKQNNCMVSGSGAYSRWIGETCGGHRLTLIWPISSAPPAGLCWVPLSELIFPSSLSLSCLPIWLELLECPPCTVVGESYLVPEWHFSLSNTIWGMFGKRNPMGKSDSLKRQKKLCLAQWYSYCRISHFQLNSQVLYKPDLWLQSDCPSSDSNRKVSRSGKDFTYSHRTFPVKGTPTRV